MSPTTSFVGRHWAPIGATLVVAGVLILAPVVLPEAVGAFALYSAFATGAEVTAVDVTEIASVNTIAVTGASSTAAGLTMLATHASDIAKNVSGGKITPTKKKVKSCHAPLKCGA